jgi:hypothetical protein
MNYYRVAEVVLAGGAGFVVGSTGSLIAAMVVVGWALFFGWIDMRASTQSEANHR